MFLSSAALLIVSLVVLSGAYLGWRDDAFSFDRKDKWLLCAVGVIAVSQVVTMVSLIL